jgi:hypothetical protein
MPLEAVRFESLRAGATTPEGHAALHVLGLRNEFKMVRVYTRLRSANMVDDEAALDGADVAFVGNAMGVAAPKFGVAVC